jgi:hypothetical protein
MHPVLGLTLSKCIDFIAWSMPLPPSSYFSFYLSHGNSCLDSTYNGIGLAAQPQEILSFCLRDGISGGSLRVILFALLDCLRVPRQNEGGYLLELIFIVVVTGLCKK